MSTAEKATLQGERLIFFSASVRYAASLTSIRSKVSSVTLAPLQSAILHKCYLYREVMRDKPLHKELRTLYFI